MMGTLRVSVRRPLMVIMLCLMTVLPGVAWAQLEIDITRGFIEPLSIAVPDFISESQPTDNVSRDISQVVTNDLERSGLFRPIDKRAFLQQPSSLEVRPNFNNWRVIGTKALLIGSAQMDNDGQLKVEFRLWDVLAEQPMTGLSLTTTPANWRRLAHMIADAIYERITGEYGYFDTRIVYISETGPQDRRVKRLAIMDQDGAGHRFLTDGSELVLTPRFSPTTQYITYLRYHKDQLGNDQPPRVYILNIDTGEQEVLGDFPGMTFAPRFSPDGRNVIMSQAKDGNSDIYVMDLRTHDVRQLTTNRTIDTSPSYDPEGRRIVFASDRGGSQQLYVMNANGTNAHRISFGDGNFATPVWSPRGDLIAFTRILRGDDGVRFFIGVMRPDGTGMRMLAEDYSVEAPTWAPNGRVIMFFRESRPDSRGHSTTRLFSIDLTGFNEREVITPLDASDPAWSPLTPR